MRDRANGQTSEEILKSLSRKHLPNRVQPILSERKEISTTLAVMDDRIFEVSGQSSTIESANIFSVGQVKNGSNLRQIHKNFKF